ncbi:MAG: hypothetical protein E7624_02805 [Ruminococcaceae bacterium]|nr:hypothetical protein [Oscillospiraceae bacterium]
MVIKKLTVLNFGSVEALTLSFSGGLHVVTERFADEVAFALLCICNSKAAPGGTYWIRGNSAFLAEVILAGKEYAVTARPTAARESFCLRARTRGGEERTEEYLYLTSHCEAQDKAEYFDGNDKNHAKRLLCCDPEQMLSAELCRATERLCRIKSFRSYLFSFIKNFAPERLREGKEYEIVLREDGEYAVQHPRLRAPLCLSESEQRLFRYLCFLRSAEFWHGFEELRNLHSVKKPLLVCHFLERLDESVDVAPLLARTKALSRQVILLSFSK